MPAIITHHLFGEEASRKLPDDLTFSEEELLAFLLGNQGPDPYYFCFTATPPVIRTCHAFAEDMHAERVIEALLAVRDAATSLPADDQGVGRAFALGLLAHYLLDSEAHAFIAAQEVAICSSGVGLEDAHDQVHALIESELDTWMLWNMRKLSVIDAPAQGNLARTERVSRVAGALFSQVAWQIFGIRLVPDRYEGCLRDYERVYQAIDPLGSRRGRMLSGAERLGSRYSILDALAHSATPSESCPAANLACKPWDDPLTHTQKTTSFADIFYDSLEAWPILAEAFMQGGTPGRSALDELVKRGYDGKPLVP